MNKIFRKRKATPRIGVVVIGRNEGERLRGCLTSLQASRCPIVYVDSGSEDGSLELATSLNAEVLALDPSRPFSAARARNEGFHRLRDLYPGLQYVQFVDGDCEVAPQWLERAVAELDDEPRLSAVCGILREKCPEASVYNRLADLEWNSQTGDISACGGIFAVRAQSFAGVGGFDVSVSAGEEPELCQRLRARNGLVRRLRDHMAWHDAAILGFGQWWSRQLRSGYGALDVATRFGRGPEQLFVGMVRSARLWGLYIPAAALAIAGLGWLTIGVEAAAAVVTSLLLVIYPLQALRVARHSIALGYDHKLALIYGALTMISKTAQVLGQWRYLRCQTVSITAHKSPPAVASAAS